jgi:hypothetical protein
LHLQERNPFAKTNKTFRLNPQVYAGFKDSASKNGYTVTGALEKFMADAVKFGLVFPSSQNASAEAEARVMLSLLKEGKYWVNLGDKEETSIRGRLLQLLPKVENAEFLSFKSLLGS